MILNVVNKFIFKWDSTVKNNLLYFLKCNMALKKAGGLNYIIMYKKEL